MPKSPETVRAADLHSILTRNLHALDEGKVSAKRAHALARLGGAIVSNAKLRMDIRAESARGTELPADLLEFAG